MRPESGHDLVVVVADKAAEQAIDELLSSRRPSLRVRQFRFTILRPMGFDSGARTKGCGILRECCRDCDHGLLIFDRHGSGADDRPADEIERGLEDELRTSGWPGDRVAVVVIDPELEAWVWGRNERVGEILRIPAPVVREALARFEASPEGKLSQPKEALEEALRQINRPLSSAVHRRLAREMGRLDDCRDRAFIKLRDTLRRWFPAG